MAESVVFGYFGLTAVAYTSQETDVGFQFHLIVYYIVCIVGARMISVTILAMVMKLIKCGRALSLNAKELCMVGMAGCMRGTIAYALILRAVPPEDEQSHVDRLMVTTVLGIVLVNCLFFGTLFPVVMRLLRLQPRPSGYHDSTPRASFGVGTRVRRGLGRWWSSLDEKFLVPVFRPQPGPNQ
ncbi:NHX3, partial [Symbiodinium necroappetens]